MFSLFKKKKIIPLIRLSGVIGNVGKFKQGIDLVGQEEIIKKAFSIKKNASCSNFNKFSWRITSSISSSTRFYKIPS